jgi:hypothetical protein
MKKSELAQISCHCYVEKMENILREELKIIIDNSIINLYGVLEASKILYSIESDKNEFKIKTPHK